MVTLCDSPAWTSSTQLLVAYVARAEGRLWFFSLQGAELSGHMVLKAALRGTQGAALGTGTQLPGQAGQPVLQVEGSEEAPCWGLGKQ